MKTGVARLNCTIGGDGKLNDCTVVSEDPPNLGFGAAAATIAEVLRLSPWLDEGDPAAGLPVSLPIRLNFAPDAKPAPSAK